MKYWFLGIICCSILSCSGKNTTVTAGGSKGQVEEGRTFYVGTYTNVKSVSEGGSEGIYRYSLSADGQLADEGLLIKLENPSFLVNTPDGRYLLAVSEVDTVAGQGTVSSYVISDDGAPSLVNTVHSGGAHPCHITINADGQVLVSNYTGGNVSLLKMDDNGRLSDLLDVQQHEGKGSHTRQEGPHAHSAWFRPDNKGILAADLGTNELWASSIQQGRFTAPTRLMMKDGAGPRHVAFHPNGRWIYVVNELDNTVGVIDVAVDGTMSIGEIYTTLPDGYAAFSKTADIHISADGRFVYASNRGHDSIAIYQVDALSGRLTLVAIQSTRGKTPRNFQLTPDNRYLIVANQDSDNMVCFARDTVQGTLTYVSEIAAPSPVCIAF